MNFYLSVFFTGIFVGLCLIFLSLLGYWLYKSVMKYSFKLYKYPFFKKFNKDRSKIEHINTWIINALNGGYTLSECIKELINKHHVNQEIIKKSIQELEIRGEINGRRKKYPNIKATDRKPKPSDTGTNGSNDNGTPRQRDFQTSPTHENGPTKQTNGTTECYIKRPWK